MEATEETTPVKLPKLIFTTTHQETPQSSSYPDWTAGQHIHQAYYEGGGGTPLQYFTSPVNGHSYVWAAGQHPMMSAYGNNPVIFPAMYPHPHHAGVYVHPSLSMGTPTAYAPSEPEEKPPTKAKSKTTTPKKKRNQASIKAAKSAASSSRTETATQSGGTSVSDGSLDANNDTSLHQEPTRPIHKKGKFEQMLADVSNPQNNSAVADAVGGSPTQSFVPGNHPNLNIGMSLWNGNPVAAASPIMQPLKTDNGVKPSDQWIQDESELKKQKRKQSNRESARRSRQRKQAECEELQKKVDSLYDENRNLAHDLTRLMEDCKKLSSENNSIKEELTSTYGPEVISDLGDDNLTSSGDQFHGFDQVKVVVNEEAAAASS